jgi:hypothetical protein
MEGAVVNNIAGLAREKTEKYALAGEELLVNGGIVIASARVKHPGPETLTVHTLTGLRDYLTENVDQLKREELAVHVVSPTRVELLGALLPDTRQRFCYVRAECYDRMAAVQGFQFGRFLSNETMIIALHALFVDLPVRDSVLLTLSSITQSTVRQDEDNGLAQAVATRMGLSMEKMTPIPNPVRLAPFRTFPEVPQPKSPFVLRMKTSENAEQPTVALFEADGGAWRDEATESIRRFLQAELGGLELKIAILA